MTGIMRASTAVLILVLPVNVMLNIVLIRHASLGLLGSPLAISITYWLAFGLLTLFAYLSQLIGETRRGAVWISRQH